MNVYILKLASPDTKFNENTCTEADNIEQAVNNLLGPKVEGRRIVENPECLWSIYVFDKHIADVLVVDKADFQEVIDARNKPVRKSNRFSYVKYDETAMAQQQELREAMEAVEALVDKLNGGRATALVYTHLEIAYMWMGKSIRDDQIHRQGKVDEQPERNDE